VKKWILGAEGVQEGTSRNAEYILQIIKVSLLVFTSTAGFCKIRRKRFVCDKKHEISHAQSAKMENKTLAPHHSDTRMLIPRNCEKRRLASSCLSVRPSVDMEQLSSYWTDFHEILYLSILRKICPENARVIKI
jgi:hypothetical protein